MLNRTGMTSMTYIARIANANNIAKLWCLLFYLTVSLTYIPAHCTLYSNNYTSVLLGTKDDLHGNTHQLLLSCMEYDSGKAKLTIQLYQIIQNLETIKTIKKITSMNV